MTRSKKLLVLVIVALAVCFSASMAFACFGDACGQWKKELLCEKIQGPLDGTEWPCVPGAKGTMKYNTKGPKFVFDFNGYGLTPGNYTLIYYPDYTGNPWPRTGIRCLDSGTTNSHGKIHLAGSVELNSDLPMDGDINLGAKIWLVSSADVNCTTNTMSGWNPTEYLFEKDINQRINYDDTDLLEVVETVDINTIAGPLVDCGGKCISFYPEQPGNWGGEEFKGAVTAYPGDNDNAGYVILNGGKSKIKAVNIRHLDGLTDDSFDLYVLDAYGNWVQLGHYTDKAPGSTTDSELWVETQFSLLTSDPGNNPVKLAGPNILIKINPTNVGWSGFATWGQLGIDKVELLGTFPCRDGWPKPHHWGPH